MIQLIARRACRSAAESEEIAQIVALDAIMAMESNSRIEPSLPWIETLIEAARKRELRHRTNERRLQAKLENDPVDLRDCGADPEAHVFAEDVVARISELPDDARAPLQMIVLEGLTYREAAARMGAPIGTVMSRLARARAHLSAMCV